MSNGATRTGLLAVRAADRVPKAGWPAAGADVRTAVAGLVFRSPPYRRFVLRGPVPADILRVYPWHAPGDRSQAEAILHHEFLFFGRRVPFAGMPWAVLPPGPVLARQLHGFAWLHDLKAVGSEEARARAQALVFGWIATHRRWSPVAWSPPVLGERLASWLAAADFVLADCSGDDRARFLEAAGRQARHLARVSSQARGADVFAALAGEIAAALCLAAVPREPPLRRLADALRRQVLPDGGHVSRDPASHLLVFRRLIDLRAALAEAGEPAPPELAAAVERMAPVLRLLRHGDGRLALFQTAKEGDRTIIDSLLAASRIGVPAPPSAPDMGYERLAAGRTIVLADVGRPPSGGHVSPLAFEMSCGRERLIVNCGAYGGDDARWRQALSSTAAHSTLTIAESNALDRGWLGMRPITVGAMRQDTDGAAWLEAAHDGYRRRFGLTHRRRLYLAEAGADLRGEDALEGRRGQPFHLRFHLHPDVQPTVSADGGSVDLRTPSGGAWRFIAVGGAISLEESAYLGASDQPRRTQQLVVSGRTDRRGARVKWALRQQGG